MAGGRAGRRAIPASALAATAAFSAVDSESLRRKASLVVRSGALRNLHDLIFAVGAITYTAACGKYFPLVTGYSPKKDESRMILAIMVDESDISLTRAGPRSKLRASEDFYGFSYRVSASTRCSRA